jgi:mono/diheme cytochrome c family protein
MRSMMRVLRTFGIVVAALVVAVVVTAGAMIQSSRASLEREYHGVGVALARPTDPAAIEDGHRLYRAYGCVSCHLEDGGGRVVIPDGIGYIAAPDITLVIDAMPVPDLDRAIRHGIRPDGTPFLLMPSHDYWYFDDESVARIIAYSRTLPPAGRAYDPSSLSMLGHLLHAIDAFPIVPAERIEHSGRRPPMGEPGTIERGRTLGRMCTGCHGASLSGGAIPGTDPAELGVPSNLTSDPSGLAAWTEDDFRTSLRTGVTPSGTLDPVQMPWRDCYQYFTDDEIHSLWLWLRDQPATPFGNR